MLIQNYGLFWRVEDVFWGSPSRQGKLMGRPAAAKSWGEVDFAQQIGIYALYADYRLIYVGQTGANGGQKLLARLNQHRKHNLAGRWNMFSWFGTRKVLNSAELRKEASGASTTQKLALDHMEAILIHVAEPSLNRQGGKWGSDVEQYLQVRDQRLGPSVPAMIEQILKEIKKK